MKTGLLKRKPWPVITITNDFWDTEINADLEYKKCGICGEILPLSEFYFYPCRKNFVENNRLKSAGSYACKPCKNKARSKNMKLQYNRDVIFRFKRRLTGAIKTLLKSRGFSKNGRTTLSILKCSFENLDEKFNKEWGPNWLDDWNNKKCSIEHIVSQKWAETEDDCLRINNWLNLKLIDYNINNSLSDRIIEEWITPDLEMLLGDLISKASKQNRIVSINNFKNNKN